MAPSLAGPFVVGFFVGGLVCSFVGPFVVGFFKGSLVGSFVGPFVGFFVGPDYFWHR